MTAAALPKAELLSMVCHLATRLQSASMIHAANVRALQPGGPTAPLQREAAAIVALAEQLAFTVAQLRDSVGQCLARPRLMESLELESRVSLAPAERFELTTTDTEGGSHD